METEKIAHPEKLKILYADDNITGVDIMKHMLKRLGHDVFKVGNGAEAVSFCSNNPDVDLVIMDIMMPIMDGIEATMQIRKFNKEVIIIALTAKVFPDDLEPYLKAGFNNYFHKPVFLPDLERLINQYFIKE